MTGRWMNLILGGGVSLLLVLGVALFSAWPSWQNLPPDTALVRLSFAQSGVRTCRDRTDKELEALAANMRRNQICERRRAPVHVEMDMDGQQILSRDLEPSGLAGSGPSRIYQRFEVPAGTHDIALRLRTDPNNKGFDDTAERRVTLASGQSLAIDYDAEAGGFAFR